MKKNFDAENNSIFSREHCNDNGQVNPVIDVKSEKAGKVAAGRNRSFFTARNMTMLAVMSAIAVVLYNWGALRTVPGFPGFLSLDLSDIPVLLAGFMLGPLGGAVVVIVRFLLKLPMSGTMFVGEAADLMLGMTFVLTASGIYKFKRTKNGALIGLGIGIIVTTFAAVLVNRFFLIPIFVRIMFDNDWEGLLAALRGLYPGITRENFFTYYLLLTTIPFNLIRLTACSIITFALYKRLGRIFGKMDITRNKKQRTAGGIKSESD